MFMLIIPKCPTRHSFTTLSSDNSWFAQDWVFADRRNSLEWDVTEERHIGLIQHLHHGMISDEVAEHMLAMGFHFSKEDICMAAERLGNDIEAVLNFLLHDQSLNSSGESSLKMAQ